MQGSPSYPRFPTWFLLLICLSLNSSAAPSSPIIHVNPSTGNLTIIDPNSLQPIPQFPASDGGAGIADKVLWIAYGLVVGIYYGAAGVRGGRLSSGGACGLVGIVSVWAAFVNSLTMPITSDAALADLILTLMLFGAFVFFTFLGAYLETMHPIGLGLLGATAGTSVFMRIVILKAGLLIPIYVLNLILLGLGAIGGGVFIIWHRRLGVILSSSLISTFLAALAVDMILNINAPQEQGMSRGLRLLMDRNPTHFADIIETNYKPKLKTQVIITISLGLVPVIAYVQHRIFPGPFLFKMRRKAEDGSEHDMGDMFTSRMSVSRFSG